MAGSGYVSTIIRSLSWRHTYSFLGDFLEPGFYMIPKYPPFPAVYSVLYLSVTPQPDYSCSHLSLPTVHTGDLFCFTFSGRGRFFLTLPNFFLYIMASLFYVLANTCVCISVCVSSAFSLALSLSLLFLLSYFCLFLLFCFIIFRSLFVSCWEGEKERRMFGWWGYGKDLEDVLRGLFVSS